MSSTQIRNGKVSVSYEGSLIMAIPNSIQKVLIKDNYGKVNIIADTLTFLTVNTISGAVVIKEGNYNLLELNSVSSPLDFQGKSKKIVIKTVSGETTLALLYNDPNIDFNSNSANLTLFFSQEPNLAIKFLTTDFNSSLKLNKEFGSLHHLTNQSTYFLGAGKGLLSFKSLSGSLKIKKTTKKSKRVYEPKI